MNGLNLIDTSESFNRGAESERASQAQRFNQRRMLDDQAMRQRDQDLRQRQVESQIGYTQNQMNLANQQEARTQGAYTRGINQEDAAQSFGASLLGDSLGSKLQYDGDGMGPPNRVQDPERMSALRSMNPRQQMQMAEFQQQQGQQAFHNTLAMNQDSRQQGDYQNRQDLLARQLASSKALRQIYTSGVAADLGVPPELYDAFNSLEPHDLVQTVGMMHELSQKKREREGVIAAAQKDLDTFSKLQQRRGLTEAETQRMQEAEAALAAAQSGAGPSVHDYFLNNARMRSSARTDPNVLSERKNNNEVKALKAVVDELAKQYNAHISSAKGQMMGKAAREKFDATAQELRDKLNTAREKYADRVDAIYGQQSGNQDQQQDLPTSPEPTGATSVPQAPTAPAAPAMGMMDRPNIIKKPVTEDAPAAPAQAGEQIPDLETVTAAAERAAAKYGDKWASMTNDEKRAAVKEHLKTPRPPKK